ncbi:SUMO1/Ulp2, putative [Trypanosoma cruzi marinkellei]|uniref:SUMO1/Ulp2, putative n=1 Tax=Trypanosoma cruzi marinkellei TaxID=85056 RepID=K2N516_TRYCR|nr:SUMO1/Ulp2, putative [Trypanosoma cruzi marinkellei]
MASALLGTAGWVHKTLFSSLRLLGRQQHEEEAEEEEEEEERRVSHDWNELPSPAVRPPAGSVEVHAGCTAGGDGKWRHDNISSSFVFPVSRHSRRRRRLRSPDSGICAVRGSRDMTHRFTEIFRRWSSRSREGRTFVDMEEGTEETEEVEEAAIVSPSTSWASTTIAASASTACLNASRGVAGGSVVRRSQSRNSLVPQEGQKQPVSADEMRHRVMSAPLSMWEVPLLEEMGSSEQLNSHGAMGMEYNNLEEKVLFAPLEPPQETPSPRTPAVEGAFFSQQDSPGATVASPSFFPHTTANRPSTVRERDAHQLALHIREMRALLLPCGYGWREPPVGDASHDVSEMTVLDGKPPPPLPTYAIKDSVVFDDLSCSLLLSAVTEDDRRVRVVYEDIMHTVCRGIVEGEIHKYIQLMEGVAERALDYWVIDIVLKDTADVMKRVFPTRALSRGIQRHIRERKAVVLTTVMEDEEDAAVYELVLRQSKRDSNQANEVAVSFQSGLSLTYRQIATLGSGQWLNDQVINAYLSMICDECNNTSGNDVVVSLGTHFFARVEQELKGNISKAMELPSLQKDSGILRWLRRRRNILQPGATRVILIPINLSQTHWALVVFNWELHTWFYYDSYICGKAAMTRGMLVLQQLSHVFLESWRILCDSEGGNVCHLVDCKLVVAEPLRGNVRSYDGGFVFAPQQSNLYDCGVFVCYMAWCAVHGVAPVFTQEDVTAHRRVMLHELLCQKSLLQFPVSAFLTPMMDV